MRDKLISWNMKTKTVKVYGPWVNGNQAVREISLEEWNKLHADEQVRDGGSQAQPRSAKFINEKKR